MFLNTTTLIFCHFIFSFTTLIYRFVVHDIKIFIFLNTWYYKLLVSRYPQFDFVFYTTPITSIHVSQYLQFLILDFIAHPTHLKYCCITVTSWFYIVRYKWKDHSNNTNKPRSYYDSLIITLTASISHIQSPSWSLWWPWWMHTYGHMDPTLPIRTCY